MKLLIHLFSGLVVASALVGCAGPRPVMPAPYTVTISATTGINPDRENRATPVQVRLFELQNSNNFERIDFYTLFDKDEQALGPDVLAKEQLTLQPGQRVTLFRKAKPDARMLGVFVAFKNLESSSWRAVTPLPQAKEVGRWGIFNPSFSTAAVTVRVGPKWVTASTMGADVPIQIPGTGGLSQIPGTGGLPQVRTPNIGSGVSLPSPFSLPTFPLSGNK